MEFLVEDQCICVVSGSKMVCLCSFWCEVGMQSLVSNGRWVYLVIGGPLVYLFCMVVCWFISGDVW